MAFAYKIAADKFGELDESLKTAYEQKGEDYVLKVEGLPEVEDVSGLKNTIAKLKDEKTAAQRKAQESADEAARIAREKATKDNDFESLFKSSESEREKLQNEHKALLNNITTEKVTSSSMRIAAQMADKDNAELLATFIKPRIGFIDGEQKILDQSGQPTVSSEADLIKEFTESGKYNALIRGNKSGGGGADAGNNGGGAAEKTVSRSDFDSMDNFNRSTFIKEGGKVIDD